MEIAADLHRRALDIGELGKNLGLSVLETASSSPNRPASPPVLALSGQLLRPVEREIEVAAAVVQLADPSGRRALLLKHAASRPVERVGQHLSAGVVLGVGEQLERNRQRQEFAKRIPAQMVLGKELLDVLGSQQYERSRPAAAHQGAVLLAPKHVQQLLAENHLRWDSLGEFLALAVSFEFLAEKTGNTRAQVLADTLDRATGSLLEQGRSPSRRVGELDNRGSHFYLALYWAREFAAQSDDADLSARFAPLAERLSEAEPRILAELSDVQGSSVTVGGYYHPDLEAASSVMRPSPTLNEAITSL